MNRRDLLRSLLAVAGASVSATTMMIPEAVVAAIEGKPVALPWLPCDGRAVSKTTYRDLWLRLQEFYRVSDNQNAADFVLPDMRDEGFDLEIYHWRAKKADRPAPIMCRYWVKATLDRDDITPIGHVQLFSGEPSKPIGAEIST